MKRIFYVLIVALLTVACEDEDKFSTGAGMRLDFEVDTLKLDTVFSNTPSSTYKFWVYNRLLVFVELTAQSTHQLDPKLVEDDLLFVQENGQEQAVNLRAWAWDARKLYDPVIEKDTVIESAEPLVIYGDLTVKEGAELTLRNTTLYFHDAGGMEINELVDTEIRNATDAIVLDQTKLNDAYYSLVMQHCVVHNSKGDGVKVTNAKVLIDHCQLTNAKGDCLAVRGGMAEINYCTIGQFYPFDAERGKAIRFVDEEDTPLKRFVCEGTIATGYADDVVEGELTTAEVDYSFNNCLLRMPAIDNSHFKDIIWESPTDEIEGKDQFVKIDEENLDYDFHLSEQSTAKGKGCY